MVDSTVCPESTLESANARNYTRKPDIKQSSGNGDKLVCESTIESANRRGFIKKAALATTALAVGSTLIGGRTMIPVSEAANGCPLLIGKTNAGTASTILCSKFNGCSLYVHNSCTGHCVSAINGAAAAGIGVVGSGPLGVQGVGKTVGVCGISCVGIGIRSTVFIGDGIPIVARGATCQTANLQQWQLGCSTPLSVINSKGWLGIGTYCPKSPLCVSSSSSSATINGVNSGTGTGVYGASKCRFGVRGCSTSSFGVLGTSGGPCAIPIVAEGVSGQKKNLQQWQIGCSVESVVNKCGWLGIGRPCAPTTLAVCGSLSARVATPSGAYTMTKSDYAVLATGDVTLPAASTAKGMIVFIKSITPTAITVSAVGSDKIEGKASENLAKKYDSLTLISDGNSPGNWYIQSNAK
jgi:hypothetical protein